MVFGHPCLETFFVSLVKRSAAFLTLITFYLTFGEEKGILSVGDQLLGDSALGGAGPDEIQ